MNTHSIAVVIDSSSSITGLLPISSHFLKWDEIDENQAVKRILDGSSELCITVDVGPPQLRSLNWAEYCKKGIKERTEDIVVHHISNSKTLIWLWDREDNVSRLKCFTESLTGSYNISCFTWSKILKVMYVVYFVRADKLPIHFTFALWE